MNLSERQQELFRYMKLAHGTQKRKYTKEPYYIHLYNVANILFSYEHYELIEIALCHDVLEDVEGFTEDKLFNTLYKSGYTILEANFIVCGVVSLTNVFTTKDCAESNRLKRKELECKRLSHIMPVFQIVKCADLIDNTKSIKEHDPKFAEVYLTEKEQILLNFNINQYKIYTDCINQITKQLI